MLGAQDNWDARVELLQLVSNPTESLTLIPDQVLEPEALWVQRAKGTRAAAAASNPTPNTLSPVENLDPEGSPGACRKTGMRGCSCCRSMQIFNPTSHPHPSDPSLYLFDLVQLCMQDNRDARVELLQKYAARFFPSTRFLDYAVTVEQYTLTKAPNLVLNVDGCIGALFLDLLHSCRMFTEVLLPLAHWLAFLV